MYRLSRCWRWAGYQGATQNLIHRQGWKGWEDAAQNLTHREVGQR
jgi:hypothetical protein